MNVGMECMHDYRACMHELLLELKTDKGVIGLVWQIGDCMHCEVNEMHGSWRKCTSCPNIDVTSCRSVSMTCESVYGYCIVDNINIQKGTWTSYSCYTWEPSSQVQITHL